MRTLDAFLAFLLITGGAWGEEPGEDFFEDVREVSPAPEVDHTRILLERQIRLGGAFRSRWGPVFSWEDFSDWAGVRPQDRLILELEADVWADARVDQSNRVLVKAKLLHPFEGPMGARLRELFADTQIGEAFRLRLGKQGVSWGYSRFYQHADVTSLEVKDPSDPSVELEGPVALKGLWTPWEPLQIELLAFTKPSFVPDWTQLRTESLGYASRFRWLAPWGGEIQAGGFYQRDLAPRLILGGIAPVPLLPLQVFTDLVVSRGSDKRFLVGEWPVMTTELRREQWFLTASVGLLAQIREWRMLAWAEYLYNGEGSDRKDFLADLIQLYALEQLLPPQNRTLTPDDLRLRSRHHLSAFVQWTDLFEVRRLGLSVLAQVNPVEPSAFLEPSLGWGPGEALRFEVGARLAWGADDTEFLVQYGGRRLQFWARASLSYASF